MDKLKQEAGDRALHISKTDKPVVRFNTSEEALQAMTDLAKRKRMVEKVV